MEALKAAASEAATAAAAALAAAQADTAELQTKLANAQEESNVYLSKYTNMQRLAAGQIKNLRTELDAARKTAASGDVTTLQVRNHDMGERMRRAAGEARWIHGSTQPRSRQVSLHP